ncbi:MAG TPA: MFS transporter [Candidatus Pullilachnospira gallistercoris]|uniref:MFS transporter n=1 Tax=Candidatus Pullilachnospira gallistercoris TaxID=2840911 RepID=A0A9D1E9D0_9FIRM|nr:MFS transporter [Candidatus Pullilachnospira gallistercoris]
MATLLLIVIYIAFIGLGVPDSLFGTAWPAIYTDLNLPVSWASIVTIIVSCGTITSSLLSSWLISRFGTGKITAVSTLMTALALLGFSCSDSMLWLCLCAIPLGLGAGSIDTALNNYVALHYKASHMNFLHCFYGIGVSLSPYLMSLALSKGTWEGGYRAVFWFQLAIAALTALALPLWKKVRHAQNGEEAEETPRVLSFPALMKMPKVRMACLVFIGYCALEYTCGTWGSTFLVNAKGAAADTAARMVTFYYVGLALGRFLSGVLAGLLHSRQLVKIGQMILLAAVVSLFLPLPFAFCSVSLFFIGLGNGPIFPNMLHLTPELFGKDLSQAVIGAEMATSYIGVLLAPALFGLIAQNVTAALFPVYLLVLYALMITGTAASVYKKDGHTIAR